MVMAISTLFLACLIAASLIGRPHRRPSRPRPPQKGIGSR
jgi:hypothetical protein